MLDARHRAARRDRVAARVRRQRAVEETRGALTGAYEPVYLSRLRSDWPE
jgi:hypothetical protein